MSGFGFEAATQASIAIDTDSGWPAMSTVEFRQHRRIPETFEEQALADSLNRSVAEVQQQLLQYLTSTTVAAQDKDVPFALDASLVPDFSEQQVSIYRAAIYARSHADLLGYFSAVDQKEAGNNKAENAEQQDVMLAQSNRSVRLLLGLGRAGVHSL
ncbi:head completion/stabilization protein [Shewanella sp. 10N.286.54.B9]|uniref:head completion/stabilization protein n=1 Tax=Shewanella sp. 10N.286.54.B9 TaxID=3229719 RepID=UPI00354EECEF